MKYLLRESEVEAIQWFKNGDHPLDWVDRKALARDFISIEIIKHETLKAEDWEGEIIRRFRCPSISGNDICDLCGVKFNDHGFIDGNNQRMVCPGDYIITNPLGGYFVAAKSAFETIYIEK